MKTCIKISFLILVIFFGCSPGYVSEEPAYVEIQRPESPNPSYIWIDNGWVYNRTSRTYVRADGVWIQPKEGRTFVPGKWESTKKGKYWKKGYWK